MKTRSTTFQAIVIMITLLTDRCSTKNSLLWQEIWMMFLSVPQTLKLLANIFLSHRYIYLVTCRPQYTWTPYYKIEKEKQFSEKNCILSKKIVLASEYYYACVIVLLFILLRRFFYMETVSSPDSTFP